MVKYQKCPECGVIAYARDYYSNGHYCFPNQGGCGAKFPVKIDKINGLFCHTIPTNNFLHKDITAFFHDFYIPAKDGGGKFSDMILAIKSNGTDAVKRDIAKIIGDDLDKILKANKGYLEKQPIVVAVPRSKPDNFWQSSELQFRPAISMGLEKSIYIVKGSDEKWMIDGTQYLTRTAPTQTTHRAHLEEPENVGPPPYPGITSNTCLLDGNIADKNIILIDDIYTENKGIDEDCIQFLLDIGAANVILYTLGMTKRHSKDTSLYIPF
jgi:hypothetical protein